MLNAVKIYNVFGQSRKFKRICIQLSKLVGIQILLIV